MRRRQDAKSNPTALVDSHVERHLAHLPVGKKVLTCDGFSVDDQFDRNFSRIWNARPLNVPVRLLRISEVEERRVRIAIEECRRLGGDAHFLRPFEVNLAVVRSNLDAVDCEVHQMALAFAHIAAPVADTLDPPLVGQPVELDVTPSQPDLVVINAGEVRLAAYPRTEAHVQCVIPDVEFPDRRRVDGRDEVDGVVRHVHNELVRADPVKPGHLVVRQFVALDLQPPPRVREAHDGALSLSPLEHRQIPGRPLVDTSRTGIVVLLQSQQHQVAGVARRKPRHLDVVVHDSLRLRKLVVLAAEKLLLVIPGRTPRQHRADVEVLAQNLPDHVLRMYAFGRILVVRTAGSVDMVVARPPAVLRRIDPSLELKPKLARSVPLNGQFLRPPVEFRTAPIFDGVVAVRQSNLLAVSPVDLRLEREVRGESFRRIRIDPPLQVLDREGRDRRFAFLIADPQRDGPRLLDVEQHQDVVAETDVLRSLPYVERDLRRALTVVPAVDLQDLVLDAQTRKPRRHRRILVHLEIRPALFDMLLGQLHCRFLLAPRPQ